MINRVPIPVMVGGLLLQFTVNLIGLLRRIFRARKLTIDDYLMSQTVEKISEDEANKLVVKALFDKAMSGDINACRFIFKIKNESERKSDEQ